MIENNQINEVEMTKQTIDYVGISCSQGSSFGFYFSTLENKDLISLNLSYTSVGNLSKLKEFPLLKRINISHSAVRDIAVLQELHELESLTIHPGQLTALSLKKLNPKINYIKKLWIFLTIST